MSEQESINVRDMKVTDVCAKERVCPRFEEGDVMEAQLGEGFCIVGNPHPDCIKSRYRVCELLCVSFDNGLIPVCSAQEEGAICKYHCSRGTVKDEQVMVRVKKPLKID